MWDHLRGLLAYEIANGGQVSIINRLDRETSGLTLIAKTRDAARLFSGLMQQRQIEKEYLALVNGWPADDRFDVDQPILRQGDVQSSRIYLKQMVHPSGGAAFTSFEVLERREWEDRRISLVRAHPHTGRMHQIRVHLAWSGHYVLGDKIYGPDEAHYLRFIETGWTDALAKELLLPRHALHSARMKINSQGHDWRSPLSEDLQAWLGLHFEAAIRKGE